jgi:hypothetical protein
LFQSFYVLARADDRKDRVDKAFEFGLLLVTVLAASELGYAAVALQKALADVNFVFRVLTIPVIALILLWLMKDLIPDRPLRIKRWIREFCWTFFGNLFVLEIVVFLMLSFFTNPTSAMPWVYAILLLALVITFPATWRYREADQVQSEIPHTHRLMLTVFEHTILFILAYFVMLAVILASGRLPTPPLV